MNFKSGLLRTLERLDRHSMARRLGLLTGLLVCLGLRSLNAMPFTPAQCQALASMVRSNPDAAKLYRKFQRLADASLADAPQPIRQIATAGRLASDPAKVESRRTLADMKKTEALGFAYAVTSGTGYGTAAKRMILDWSATYQPSGQPIDETKLQPLFAAYGLTRPVFTEMERHSVESWLRRIAQCEWDGVRPGSVTASNNWNSHRLNIVGQIGFLLGDQTWIGRAVSGFKEQIESNLRPDGSSLDFHERDALYYHCYDLEPLLALAIAAHQQGLDLYHYQAPNGASLAKAVEFLVPYCQGAATHAEWVDSMVAFDRARAKNGEAAFAAGVEFNPQRGLPVLAMASFFDQSLNPLVAKLAHRKEAVPFPVWQSVLNQALRE